MNKNLETKSIKIIVEYLKNILLLNQQLVIDRKEKGIKTYSLEEYNKAIKLIYPESKPILNNPILLKNIEQELSENLLLTNEEIKELTMYLEELIIKYGIKNTLTLTPLSSLIQHVFNKFADAYLSTKEKKELRNKWKEAINVLEKTLDKYGIKYTSNELGFCLKDNSNRYVYSLDILGNDELQKTSFPTFAKSKGKIYLAKNIYLAKLNEGESEFIYKENDSYQSIEKDKEYKPEEINKTVTFNDIIKFIGMEQKEVYTSKELEDIIQGSHNTLEDELEIIKNMTHTASTYLEEIIFSNDKIYSIPLNISKLLPIYTEEQKNLFKDKLSEFIIKELMTKRKLKLSIAPTFKNPLIELLSSLLIIPSPYAIGKNITLDLDERIIIVEDELNNSKQDIYEKKAYSKIKKY